MINYIYTIKDSDGRGDKLFHQISDVLAARSVLMLFQKMGRFTKLTLTKLGEYDSVKCEIKGCTPVEIDVDEVCYLDSLEHPDEYKEFNLVVPEKYQNKVLDDSDKGE